MKASRHSLAEAIAERTLKLDARDSGKLAQEIAAYLIAEHRTVELESILRDIMQYRSDRGVLEAEMVTAYDVEDLVLQDVKQLLRASYPDVKAVHVGKRLDRSVIGGLRIDMANQQLDMTVKAKLTTFKHLTAGENS
ncbi:F0F1 ATP synthase subunit delta [Candidatus Saccharibacteria bacterium]|nr:F0F1 ATP synthase subunit delta [Candidatus Saccharibacteria bacterium]MBI3338010.1 F0F1 ATP synthase subunit delta [Candidatus Saccharibacteria bacterium]